METQSRYSKYRDFLWPLGGTLLGLIVIPVAIEQYPELFKENAWILPVSVGLMVLCWIVPLFFHQRFGRLIDWVGSQNRTGKIAALLVSLILVFSFYCGGRKVVAFHRNHLRSRLGRAESGNAPIVVEPQIFAEFIEAHSRYKQELKDPNWEVVADGAYAAKYKHAIVFWLDTFPGFVILLDSPIGSKEWIWNKDINWESGVDTDENLRKRFANTGWPVPKESKPAFGGMATLFFQKPKYWIEKIGWREWDCTYDAKSIHWQSFEQGGS